MAALLALRNIETYYGPVMAIKGVSMEVREGQVAQVEWREGYGGGGSESWTFALLLGLLVLGRGLRRS